MKKENKQENTQENANVTHDTAEQRGFLKKLLMGLIVGIACITPGLSGGVIAAAAGLYEPSVNAIVKLPSREFKKSFLFLLPLGIGVGVGVLGFSKIMEMLMLRAEFSIVYVFLGLVAGSLPAFIGEANEGGFRLRYLWGAVIAFACVIVADRIMEWVPNQSNNVALTPVNILICGAVLSVGTIVPGISSSFVLMYMGVYEGLLRAVTSFDIKTIVLLVAGFGAMSLLIIKLVEIVFRKFHGMAYYTVLGFLLGSMVAVFPGLRTGWSLALDIALFCVSTFASYVLLVANSKKA